MSTTLDVNWGPCALEWPKYQQYLSNTPYPVGPCLIGITSLTFRHTEFIGTGGVYLERAQDLVTVSFPNLAALTTVQNSPPSTSRLMPLMTILDCPALTTVDFPALNSVGGYRDIGMLIIRNASLTSINLPVFLLTSPLEDVELDFRDNALTESVVDNILARVDASPNPSGLRFLLLQGGTNATPSASGLVSKASLIGKGWTVSTN